MSRAAAYRSITTNALSADRASEWTRSTLNGLGLLEDFDDHPETALAALHEIVTSGPGGPRELFALAELYLYADTSGQAPYDLAAALYAHAFLFPEQSGDIPGPFDPRARIATDLYNHAVTAAFESKDGGERRPRAGNLPPSVWRARGLGRAGAVVLG